MEGEGNWSTRGQERAAELKGWGENARIVVRAREGKAAAWPVAAAEARKRGEQIE